MKELTNDQSMNDESTNEWIGEWCYWWLSLLLLLSCSNNASILKKSTNENTTITFPCFSFLFLKLPQLWQQLDWLVANTMMCFGPWIQYMMAYEKKKRSYNFKMIIWMETDGISVVMHIDSCILQVMFPTPFPWENVTFAIFLSPPPYSHPSGHMFHNEGT